MAPNKWSKGKQGAQGQPQAKPTHFVCFPLVTEESIPQLKEALAKFRRVTTPIARAAPTPSKRVKSEDSLGSTAVDGDLDEAAAASNDDDSVFSEQNLRQIPSSAHRPPGTFHLTLGVMDLSEPEDMDRALRLLEEINYATLLRQAEATVSQRRIDRESKKRDDLTQSMTSSTQSSVEEGKEKVNVAAGSIMNAPLESLDRAISPPAPSRPSELPPAPLSLTIHGLGTFPNPRSSRVFFGHVHDESHRLQTFAELVRQRFMDTGLITETRPLVLHATVANLIYVKDKGLRGRGGNNAQGKKKGRGEVDARDIIKLFNNDEVDSYLERFAAGDENVIVSSDSQRSAQSIKRLPTSTSETNRPERSPFSSESKPHGLVWARDIKLDRVRICKMGAEQCDIPDWGMEYKPIAEQVFFLAENRKDEL